MPEATEMLEHMEHAGHAGHGGHGEDHKAGPGKQIGITMAILGVMLAFCAAMVGSARTELIATMVEQSNRWSLYQAESMKYRVMEADVEMLHALTPSKAEVNKFEEELKKVKRPGGKDDDEDTQELKAAIELSTKELADVLTPDKEDEDRLLKLARRYEHDMAEAKEDAEAYDDAIHAHFRASEHYEWAQLMAEIGIVIASIALLMSNRAVWSVAVLLGAACAGTIAHTHFTTHSALAAAERKIEEAQKRTELIEDQDKDDDDKSGASAPAKQSGASAPANPNGGGSETKPGETKPEAKPEAKPGGEPKKEDKKEDNKGETKH
jgi:hypothetical protein